MNKDKLAATLSHPPAVAAMKGSVDLNSVSTLIQETTDSKLTNFQN